MCVGIRLSIFFFVHDHKLTAVSMNVREKHCPISDPPQHINQRQIMYSTAFHALLRPRSQCWHDARRVGPEAARLFPVLAEGELGELSAIISPDRRCFRPDATDAGKANCANTACSSPSFDGQTGTGIHDVGLALVCTCDSACVCCVSKAANGQISSSSRQGDVEVMVVLVGE